MAWPRHAAAVRGAGLGLRRAMLEELSTDPLPYGPDFFEVAPENWMELGGRLGRRFRALTEAHPFVCHGLSLDIGGPSALDEDFVRAVGRFLDSHGIADYTEHLSYCGADGHLYDLMPIPFTTEAVHHVAERVRRVQEILGRRIALENVSYYLHPPGSEISELEFIQAVLDEADCDLLLDVNNVFVNACNHDYDPVAFLDGLPLERVRYLHVAGHRIESRELRVDTHGAAICPDVWTLLAATYQRLGPVPTLLERDFNLPPLTELYAELAEVRHHQDAALAEPVVAHG